MGKTTNSLTSNKVPQCYPFHEMPYKNWLHKATMWCVGNRNIPHVGQDTNASIEYYHTNIKKKILVQEKD
jgi:hypothetical protein